MAKARKKRQRKGKIVTFWLEEGNYDTWAELENKSNFVNIALRTAVGIMAWDLMHKADPKRFPHNDTPLEEVLPEFNEKYPLDPLTKKRKEKQWLKSSANNQELW